MNGLGIKVPSAKGLLNITLGLLIVFAVVRFVVPERFKTWFRV